MEKLVVEPRRGRVATIFKELLQEQNQVRRCTNFSFWQATPATEQNSDIITPVSAATGTLELIHWDTSDRDRDMDPEP